MNDLFLGHNYDQTLEIKDRISRCFSRPLFLVLYVISPETLYHLVILSIAQIERKQKISLDQMTPEQDLITAVDNIVHEIFVTKKELEAFLVQLNKKVLALVVENASQKIVAKLDEESW